MRPVWTIKKLTYVLSLLFLAPAAVAQDDDCWPDAKALTPGVCQNPTPERVLHVLTTMDGSDEWLRDAVEEAIEAVLRQAFEPRSAAELDAFAEDLGRIYRDTPYREVAWTIKYAVRDSDGEGERISRDLVWDSASESWEFENRGREEIPYAGATEFFVRTYKSFEDPRHLRAKGLLYSLPRLPGGLEYLRGLLASLEQPPPCTWRPQTGPPIHIENPCPNEIRWRWCDVAKHIADAEKGPFRDLYKSLSCTQPTFTKVDSTGRIWHGIVRW